MKGQALDSETEIGDEPYLAGGGHAVKETVQIRDQYLAGIDIVGGRQRFLRESGIIRRQALEGNGDDRVGAVRQDRFEN